jgi:DNA-binding response OmpR family regulator
MNHPKARILIVDDTPENIDVLVGLLGESYELSVALEGETALSLVNRFEPDLILLDVMMPGLDGYAVCEKLKSGPATADVPVIFLTALSSDDQEQKGLELGAADYITKPFSPSLVRCRIANHLALAAARKELRAYSRQLEDLVAKRTAQLQKAHEQLQAIDETKNEFLSAIAHELRTPANGIFGIGSLAVDSLPDGPEKEELQQCFDRSTRRLTEMLDSAMHLARLQSGDASLELEPTVLQESVQQTVEKVMDEVPGVSILISDKGGLSVPVCVDPRFFGESLETLLAATAKLNTGETPVKISGEPIGGEVVLNIYAGGAPVPEELMNTIFEPFSPERSASYVEELGLRLPVAEKMIRAMGGKVAIQNITDTGFIVSITVPVSQKPEAL